jgi:uncharacterized protein GlcG (DUF336 family)
MKNLALVVITCCAAVIGVAPAESSRTNDYHYSLPLNLALQAATEAVGACLQRGYHVTATVVDMDGVPQVSLRGDGATIHTAESSFDKAYTVVTLGPIFDFDTSSKFFEMVKTSPYAPALAMMRNVMALPGAVAFKSKNAIVGALGVGGAPGGRFAHTPALRKLPIGFRNERQQRQTGADQNRTPKSMPKNLPGSMISKRESS